jgi:hypothetical protein
MIYHPKALPAGWLAFELNVLRRMKFSSIAMPFTPSPVLGTYLKRHNIRVFSNDLMRSSWTPACAEIQNNTSKLSDDEVNQILEDAYVPGHRLDNPSLRKYFGETDSWWFDNVRRNLERLEAPYAAAIGASIVMDVIDYVRSFDEDTRDMRQPLSNVFRRLWLSRPDPFDNRTDNPCHNKTADDFISEVQGVDLMFLRLPPFDLGSAHGLSGNAIVREEWVRGGDDFWPELETSRIGKFGMPVETRSQYFELLGAFLQRSKHIRRWAIAHIEYGSITTREVMETISKAQRKLDTIYSKDLSELAGAKAVIITAEGRARPS